MNGPIDYYDWTFVRCAVAMCGFLEHYDKWLVFYYGPRCMNPDDSSWREINSYEIWPIGGIAVIRNYEWAHIHVISTVHGWDLQSIVNMDILKDLYLCWLIMIIMNTFIRLMTGRGVATGAWGHVPPTNSRCTPGAPPPTKKKIMNTFFFFLPISRVCKYFAPHKNHAYVFLKYALKCLFVNACSSPCIHIESNSTFIM